MKRKNSKLIIILLIFFISIGFAYLSTNLFLTGTGIFSANSWDIYFDNVSEETYKTDIVSAATISNKVTINTSINLNQPKSTYTMIANVVNDGSIDAMLDSWTITNDMDTDEAKVFDFSLSYADDIALNKNDILKANSFDTIKLVVTYKDNISNSELLTSDGNLNLTITLNYVQADEDAVERGHNLVLLWPDITSFTYNRSNGITTCNIVGTPNRWEIFYKKLYLKSGNQYSITVNYNIPATYHNLNSTYLGIGIQVLNSIPKNSANATSIQIVREFMETELGDYSSTLNFTASSDNYLVFNGGMALDGENCSFKIKNIVIKKVN